WLPGWTKPPTKQSANIVNAPSGCARARHGLVDQKAKADMLRVADECDATADPLERPTKQPYTRGDHGLERSVRHTVLLFPAHTGGLDIKPRRPAKPSPSFWLPNRVVNWWRWSLTDMARVLLDLPQSQERVSKWYPS